MDQNNPDQPIYKKDEEIKIKSKVGFDSEESRVIGMIIKLRFSHSIFSPNNSTYNLPQQKI